MKKVSIYRPTSVDEAIQILSQHGSSASVYAGGTDLLVRLKNRLEQAPSYLVDIKTTPRSIQATVSASACCSSPISRKSTRDNPLSWSDLR